MMSMEAGIGVTGTELRMMAYFKPEGKVVPVTVVGFREGNSVTQIKNKSTDGYNAVQIRYCRVRDKKLTKPEIGHLNKISAIPMRHLQEFHLTSVDGFELNQHLVESKGTILDGPMSHGSKSHRALGLVLEQHQDMYKGKKMPGRMGGTKTKIQKLKIVKIDNDLRIVMINGVLPGNHGNLLRITLAKIVGKNIPKN